MTGTAPTLVPLREVDTGALLDLLRTCLGPAAAERSEEFWRWKHGASPFGPSPGLVALDRGRPVALRTFLRWRWRAGERTWEAVRAVDTATHPDWRRRGLFRRLTLELLDRLEAEGTAFVFNTPNATSRAGYLALGWHDVGRVPVMVRPRHPVRLLAAWGRRPRTAAAAGSSPGPPTAPGLRAPSELLAEPSLTPFLEAWNRDEPRLHTPRTADYLDWRYARAPGLGYRAAWRLEGSSGAVAVVRPRLRRGLRELAVVELLVSRDRAGRRAAKALLARIAASRDADHLAAAASPGTEERRLLWRSGFLPLPGGPRWTVRRLATIPAGGEPALEAARSWRVSAGDLELF